jgi:hypothetical protein
MLRRFSLGIVASLLLPAVALAGSVREKRHVVYHWRGYGFLPGYHQPPSPGEVHYGTPSYLYGGGRYYFGEPGFFAWPLEWRQLRAVLDPHAYRTDVELWINLCAISASAQWTVDR